MLHTHYQADDDLLCTAALHISSAVVAVDDQGAHLHRLCQFLPDLFFNRRPWDATMMSSYENLAYLPMQLLCHATMMSCYENMTCLPSAHAVAMPCYHDVML